MGSSYETRKLKIGYPMILFDNENFQTPPSVCEYMVDMIHPLQKPIINILEPTPGKGNLGKAIDMAGYVWLGPDTNEDFWKWIDIDTARSSWVKFDFVLMNPPFFPIKEMERFVNKAMELSDDVIALLPWIYIINSERRLDILKTFGIVSITYLPRSTFPGCRVQCCIIYISKGYQKSTEFKQFKF